METTQLILNKQLVTLRAEPHIIKRLNEDNVYLARYLRKASKVAKLNFLFKHSSVKKMVVRRVPASKPVWIRKGKPSKDDLQATSLLLQLRASEKYASQFVGKYSIRKQVWEKIALEMKTASGFEVDGPMCAEKFQNLSKSYNRFKNVVGGSQTFTTNSLTARSRFYDELCNILANNFPVGNVGDEVTHDSVSKNEGRNKRKSSSPSVTNDANSEIWEFLQEYLKRKTGEQQLNYQEILLLLKEKTNSLKQELEQSERMINLLETLLRNTSA